MGYARLYVSVAKAVSEFNFVEGCAVLATLFQVSMPAAFDGFAVSGFRLFKV